MRILTRHLTVSFLTSFVATLAVVTFVMSLVPLCRATDLLARGMSWRPIWRMFGLGLPLALSYAIPVSALTATLLVFGRLSSDGEITAMKACGVSMLRIARVPLLPALLLTVMGTYINVELVPETRHQASLVRKMLRAENPLNLLVPGRFARELPGLLIYVGEKLGNRVDDVIIADYRQGRRREVRAHHGFVTVSEDGASLRLELAEVRIDPFVEGRPGAGYASSYRLPPIELRARPGRSSGQRRTAHLTLPGVLDRMDRLAGLRERLRSAGDGPKQLELGRELSRMRVELHKRLALSVSCLAFVLIGVPLGVKVHRRESSIGVALSLAVVLNFYLFVIVAEALARIPRAHPHVIVWIPVATSALLGLHLLRRLD